MDRALTGFAKYSGVSLTEDMTGEFFGTFLVPSLVHQDPHYHREPYMPIKHRILHAFVQVVWTAELYRHADVQLRERSWAGRRRRR